MGSTDARLALLQADTVKSLFRKSPPRGTALLSFCMTKPYSDSHRNIPLSLLAFMQSQTLKRYLSDIPDKRHRSLNTLTPEEVGKTKVDHFVVIDRMLARAKKDLPDKDFQTGFTALGHKYGPPDMDSRLALALQQLGDIDLQNPSPGKQRGTDTSEINPSEIADRQRRSDALAQERADARLDLDYTYVPMDTGKS